ncbi:protein phosphatase 1 regulatory subunit 14A isoform X1 [Camelus ferus]|uniref:Protein phosphatase 1 regulatory subunit 14 n=2 Tax=Camelus TaxID=9836 RepID=A0A8B8TIH5_CAMFR|nr:protein phosphatase 1 regulatory subunit 14A isoform X1 [Camelus ferus]XP_032342041.1 protein phosphatase 1 regulatory subunit 14A isoform X1 [Camelus ferus]XP_045379478.1 protein phosphatase 1 regulatory subunit 14A isoform X1 [Camelus bactrianus]
MAAQRLGKRVLSKLQSPSRARGPGGSPGGLQKRHARVTVKYDRRELQRRLDVEKWIDGRLEELYRGREADMPDEVNIDELLELESEEERSRKIQIRKMRPREIQSLAQDHTAQREHNWESKPGTPKVVLEPHRGLCPGAAGEAARPPQAARPPPTQSLW